MAGVTIMPINRAQVCTPSLYSGGGSAVAGFPIENIVDPTLTHQARILPNGGAGGDVIIQFDMGSQPAASGAITHGGGGADVDYEVGGLFIGNHNIDGLSIEFRGNTAANYAGATSMFALSLDNYTGNSYVFKTFSPYAYRYWFLKIAGSTLNPTRIGCVAFGPTFDLGTYMRPGGWSSSPQSRRTSTMRGHDLPGRVEPPVVSRTYQFKNPLNLTSNVMLSRDAGSGHYVGYNTLQRAFSQEYQTALAYNGLYRTGVCAGAGYPMPYHEGAMKGVSGAGRPAQMAFMDAEIPEFWAAGFSAINLTLRDAIPRGYDLKPAGN